MWPPQTPAGRAPVHQQCKLWRCRHSGCHQQSHPGEWALNRCLDRFVLNIRHLSQPKCCLRLNLSKIHGTVSWLISPTIVWHSLVCFEPSMWHQHQCRPFHVFSECHTHPGPLAATLRLWMQAYHRAVCVEPALCRSVAEVKSKREPLSSSCLSAFVSFEDVLHGQRMVQTAAGKITGRPLVRNQPRSAQQGLPTPGKDNAAARPAWFAPASLSLLPGHCRHMLSGPQNTPGWPSSHVRQSQPAWSVCTQHFCP